MIVPLFPSLCIPPSVSKNPGFKMYQCRHDIPDEAAGGIWSTCRQDEARAEACQITPGNS